MEYRWVGRFASSFGISLALTVVLSALLVVLKESVAPVMDWMKALTGHHWITHGLLTLVAFVALGFVLAPAPRVGARALTRWIAGAVILGALIVAGFFVAGL